MARTSRGSVGKRRSTGTGRPDAVIAAFTLDELEQIVEWGDWKLDVLGKEPREVLEPVERELLERIRRLAKGAP